VLYTLARSITTDLGMSLSGVLLKAREDAVWQAQVDDVLFKAAGREVSVSDVLLLSKYNAIQTRPLLVKLESAWNTRIVLSGAHKLTKEVDLARVFILPDETLEGRRKTRSSATAKKQGVSL